MGKLDKQHFEELIMDDSFLEYARGENCSSVNKWEAWKNENPHLREEFEMAVLVARMLINRQQVTSPEIEKSLNKVLEQIGEKETGRQRWLKTWWARTAVVLLLAVVGASLGYFLKPGGKPPVQAALAYHEITVPIGEKAHIELNDGSRIWINSDSRLKYSNNFSASREVYLEGEAFFDVAPSADVPFVVNTKTIRVKVLGTAFNIKSYPDDKSTETTVVRGLVSVENINNRNSVVYLKPNESYVLNSEEKNAAKKESAPVIAREVNVEPVISWKDQNLVFMNETLEEVAVKLERWYNVKIHILDQDLKKDRYRGKFMRNENVYQVLEAIKITTPIEYRVEKDEIFIGKIK